MLRIINRHLLNFFNYVLYDLFNFRCDFSVFIGKLILHIIHQGVVDWLVLVFEFQFRVVEVLECGVVLAFGDEERNKGLTNFKIFENWEFINFG